jgi:hypothetical protein
VEAVVVPQDVATLLDTGAPVAVGVSGGKDSVEIWKPVPDHTGYEVSDFGRVRSWRPASPTVPAPTTPRILKSCPNSKGYLVNVFCSGGGKKKTRTLHRLVLEVFRGACPRGHEGSHLNGVKADCRLENLAWETHGANMDRCYEHGTAPVGERNPRARLTSAQVKEARAMRSQGKTYNVISKFTGLSIGGTAQAVSGRNWKTVV